MPTEEHPFFRSRALQHYLEGREESVAPRLISPPVFACLWILLFLLVVGIVGASFFKIPVYAPGVAIVTRGACAAEADCKLMIVALLPPESLSRLRVGQTIYLEQAGNPDRLRATLTGVESAVESPETIRSQFGIDDKSLALGLDHPAAVAIAKWDGADAYAGSVLPVQVEFGSRRILSLLGAFGGKAPY
jgi:hypothetical protein